MRISSKWRGVPPPTGGGAARTVGVRLTASPLEHPRDRRSGVTPLPRCTRGLLTAVAAIVALVGCDPPVRGDGRYYEEARTFDEPFTGVRAQDRLSVFVTAGREQTVTVSGDGNIVRDKIKTRLLDPVMVGTQSVRVLHAYVDPPDYEPTIPPRVVITVASFAYVNASDASKVEVRGAEASTFRVQAGGESIVTLVGTPGADELEIELVNANLEADTYPVGLAFVELMGNSSAHLSCAGPVTGTASGTSVVDNRLGAGECEVELSGAASCLSPP